MSISDMINKSSPLIKQKEMSKSEYKKLVDRNTELIDKMKDLQNRINKAIEDLEKTKIINIKRIIGKNTLIDVDIDHIDLILTLELEEKEKEIERLNNIINELEKYINEEYIYDELGMKIFDASKLQDKLQELKGDGSNEKTTDNGI